MHMTFCLACAYMKPQLGQCRDSNYKRHRFITHGLCQETQGSQPHVELLTVAKQSIEHLYRSFSK